MRTALFLLAFAVLGLTRAPVAHAEKKPVPAITLYTMGKGDVLWAKFGHAAICTEYPAGAGRPSRCYNYGTTDFLAPISLGWGFLRGEGRFWVSVISPQSMIRRYIGFDRTIWKQTLPLSDEQALAIEAKLEHDVLPENRFYTYHHFYDNCTTRIRDVIDQVTDHALKHDTDTTPGPSFREFSREGLADATWVLMLTDYFLGHDADKRPNLWQAMFLPDYLREQVQKRLGAEPVVIYERRGPPFNENPNRGRGWLVLLALVLALPVAMLRFRPRFERSAIAWMSIPLFLIGLLVWFLAAVTSVKEFRYNEALLVYCPWDIALLFMGPERRRLYARVRTAALLVPALLLIAGVFTQPLWVPMLVVLLPMGLLAVSPIAPQPAPSDSTGQKNPASRRPGRKRKKR